MRSNNNLYCGQYQVNLDLDRIREAVAAFSCGFRTDHLSRSCPDVAGAKARGSRGFFGNGLMVAVLLFSGTLVMRGQGGISPQTLHGTVNIVLGNGNGAVVATDSRLSGGDGRPAGLGQKLFKVDEHTLCAIAGFFSDKGPDFGGDQHAHLASTSIPGIVNAYLSRRQQTSIEVTASEMAGVIVFSLDLIANLDLAASDLNVPLRLPDESQVTIVGYEKGVIKVARVDLVPTLVGRRISYVIGTSSVESIGARLFEKLAGIEDVGRPLLALRPAEAARLVPADPAVVHYAKEMEANQGESLSLRDIEQLAGDVEFMTSKVHPNQVGGSLQIATLSEGKVSHWESVFSKQDLPTENVEMLFSNNFFDHGFPRIVVSPTHGGFLEKNVFENVGAFPIDNLIVVQNTFRNTKLTYSGSMALLDSSNVISDDSLLLVDEQVSEKNPVLKQIRKSFPRLRIERQKALAPAR